MTPDIKHVVSRTIPQSLEHDFISDWANSFYQAKQVEGVSGHTLAFYRQQLTHFLKFCEAQLITTFEQLTPNVIRAFLLWHTETGHNAGGLNAAYRVLRTFLLWYASEAEPEGWANPIRKVKAPRLHDYPLEPAKLGDISAMVRACGAGFLGDRDRAILLSLLDTGARAREFLKLNSADVNLTGGMVQIHQGKGGKDRAVFLGTKARKALRAYLRRRKDTSPALWVSVRGERLSYGGLRGMVAKRAELAGINPPTLHAFRRAFAVNMLRAGVDVYSLAALMGHANLEVLRRYLKLLQEDLQSAHGKGSPVDKGIL